MSHPKPGARMSEAHLTRLVLELLDAHEDTARLAEALARADGPPRGRTTAPEPGINAPEPTASTTSRPARPFLECRAASRPARHLL
jgi:hypothetical protein